jgi:hypothetical protein
VGLSAHTVDIATSTIYATGAFGMGGYEKIVEFSCGVTNYVCFAMSGYNGNFGGNAAILARKQAQQPLRADGTAWVHPQNIVPVRVYIGAKGYEVRIKKGIIVIDMRLPCQQNSSTHLRDLLVLTDRIILGPVKLYPEGW